MITPIKTNQVISPTNSCLPKNIDKPPLSPTKCCGRHKIYFPIVKLQHRRAHKSFSINLAWCGTYVTRFFVYSLPTLADSSIRDSNTVCISNELGVSI